MFLRPETPADHPAVRALIRCAFAGVPYSDQQEHELVERLRRSDAFLPELSWVAEREGEIVGHILLTRIHIVEGPTRFPALALAPVSVLPAWQGQGIGGRLIETAHDAARKLGEKGVVLLGHATYYPRFGYQPAHAFGIRLPFDVPPENCLVVELQPGALREVRGTVEYPAEFGG